MNGLKIWENYLTANEMMDQHGVVRVGSTINLQQRVQSYEQEGYRGTIYFCKSDDIKRDETLFIKHYKQIKQAQYNEQLTSNQQENTKGYVYTIIGEKNINQKAGQQKKTQKKKNQKEKKTVTPKRKVTTVQNKN